MESDPRHPAVPCKEAVRGLGNSSRLAEDKHLPGLMGQPVTALHEVHVIFHYQVVTDFTLHSYPPPLETSYLHSTPALSFSTEKPSRSASARTSSAAASPMTV